MQRKRLFYIGLSILLRIVILGFFLRIASQARASVGLLAEILNPQDGETLLDGTRHWLYIPMAMSYSPWQSMFGVEAGGVFLPGDKVVSSIIDLPAGWVRLNNRISWRFLQPKEEDPIQWDQLSYLEAELRTIKAAGITPIVVVDDYPRWATDITVREDGQPTSCGRLLEDKVEDFAAFMVELVNHFKLPEFGVRNWELGNEPDVDPDRVPPDNIYGCWGDMNDPYFGGEAYGRMLIQVGGAIKSADRLAQVWLGGLLLGSPSTTDPNEGHPELFFEGILRSGAAPYFDVVPYHWYPSYGQQRVFDFDRFTHQWASWGGGTVGKARFLRQTMQKYSVSKPVFLNETAFGCPYDWAYVDWCLPPTEDFFDLQASYVVRAATRAYNEELMGFIWYSIDAPALRWWSLLDDSKSPRPVYWSYSQVINQFRASRRLGAVSYEPGIEAYAFDRRTDRLDVLWAIEDQKITVTIPTTDWIGAYGRDGEYLTPIMDGSNYLLPVGFSPVYLVRQP